MDPVGQVEESSVGHLEQQAAASKDFVGISRIKGYFAGIPDVMTFYCCSIVGITLPVSRNEFR